MSALLRTILEKKNEEKNDIIACYDEENKFGLFLLQFCKIIKLENEDVWICVYISKVQKA